VYQDVSSALKLQAPNISPGGKVSGHALIVDDMNGKETHKSAEPMMI
jgi:hypothetical protein